MRSLRFLFLLCAGAWLTLAFTRRTLVTRDLGATHLPWRAEWARQVGSGWVPLWNPGANGGRPLWADPNAQAAYPGTLLFLLVPAPRAMPLFLAAHHLWLLWGLAFLARKSGASAEAALASALILGTGGVPFSLTTFPNALASFSWLPWALALLLGPDHEPPRAARRGLAAGGLLGVSFLAGEPVTAGAGLALAGALMLAQRRRLWPTALLFFGFFAASLPVLLPLVAVFPETVRGSLGVSRQALAADCLAPRRFVELFFPRLLGTPLGDASSGFWAAASFPWQRYYPLLFFGAGASVLLWVGVRRRPSPRFWLFALVAGLVAAALPAFPPAAETVYRLPGGSLFRFAVKALQVVLLAAVPLVAQGLEQVKRRASPRSWPMVVAAAGFLLPAVFPASVRAALGRLFPASAGNLALISDSTWQGWLVLDGLANAMPLLALALTRSLALTAFAFLAVQWPLFFTTHVIVPERLWRDPPAAVRTLAKGTPIACFAGPPDSTPSRLTRTFAFRNALVPDYGMTYGLSYVLARGPDGLEPVRGELLAAYGEKLAPAAQLQLAASLGARAAVLTRPAAGADCQPADGLFLCRPRQAAPEAYLARRVFPGHTLEEVASWLSATSFVPGEDAVLENLPAPLQAGGGEVIETAGPPHHRRFRVRAPARTFLVVQQNYLSAWRARVDGVAVPVLSANFARVAVPVPAGEHLVEIQLDPRPYTAGALGPVVFALTWWALRSGGRRAPSGAPGRSTRARAPAP